MSDGIRPLDLGRVTIGSTCPPEMAAIVRDTPRRMADEQAAWAAELRAAGVKAAHPDDGWVDRQANTVHLAYATFNDNLQVGDLLALGSPWDSHAARIVRVTGTVAPGPIMRPLMRPGEVWRYTFEAARP